MLTRRGILKLLGTSGIGCFALTKHSYSEEKASVANSAVDKISICAECPERCQIAISILDGKYNLGCQEQMLGENKFCGRAYRNIEILKHPDRLTRPLKRIGERGDNKWEPISWESAMQIIINKISENRSNSSGRIAFISGLSAPKFFPKYFTDSLGNGIYSDYPECNGMLSKCNSELISESNVKGKNLLVFGANPMESNPILGDCIIQLRLKNKLKMTVIDPRYSNTARFADTWLPVQPGKDIYILRALLSEIIRKKKLPVSSLSKEFIDKIQSIAMMEYEKLSGLSAGLIECLCEDLLKCESLQIILGSGILSRKNADLALEMAQVIETEVNGKQKDSSCSNKRTDYVSFDSIYDSLSKEGNIEHRILIFHQADTLASYQKEDNKLKNVLTEDKGVDFILVADMFMTETAMFADLVLPDSSAFERKQIEINKKGSLAYFDRIIEPQKDIKDFQEVLASLASELQLKRVDGVNLYSIDEFHRTTETRVKASDKSLATEDLVEKYPVDLPELRELAIPDGLLPIAPYTSVVLSGDEITWKDAVSFDIYKVQTIWMNPKTANDKKLSNGDRVILKNAETGITSNALLKITESIRPDCVAFSLGANYLTEDKRNNMSAILSDKFDNKAGRRLLYDVYVSIEKAV